MQKLKHKPEYERQLPCGCELTVDKFNISILECKVHIWMFQRIPSY